MNENCWYIDEENNCLKGKEPQWCDDNCPIYKNMRAHFESSNLPKRYWWPFTLKVPPVDKEAVNEIIQVRDNLSEFVSSGKNLLIQSSKCGNGKTSWGIKLLQKQIELNYKGSSLFGPPAFFVYTPNLLLEARKSIPNKNSQFDILELYFDRVPLVLFDDIGCVPLKDYDLLILSTILENRILKGLSNIYTTNLQDDNLKEVLGERLYDRIMRLSKVVTLKANSLRGTNV